ncbi:MAG: translation initiation factor IF-2, partial [Planctomycetes bacterium]|nr:translation initiation factor IF-2 [Planctomycetota bacterium]
ADSRVRRAAKREGVDYRLYNIIYQAVDEIRQSLEGLLEPIVEEKVVGQAKILQVFKISRLGNIAGSIIQEGKLRKGDKVRIHRGEEELGTDVITTLKRFKSDAAEVISGQECGIGLGNFRDFEPDDIIESIEVITTARRL